jgi:trk system potassium uptake protein TrkA
MYIIIAGAGMVGSEVASNLVDKKHDVVIIDEDKEVCDRLYSGLGVIAVNGNAARIETLIEADVRKADVLAAMMRNDVDNLACAILAKSLGVPRVIVRMRNTSYENAYKLAGVTAIVRVADLLINEVMMEIEQPDVRRIMTIGGGKGEVFMVVVPQGSRSAGRSVNDITKDSKFPAQCVFFAVYNNETGEFSFPRGDHVIHEGDQVFLVAPAENVKKVADFLTDTGRRRSLREGV